MGNETQFEMDIVDLGANFETEVEAWDGQSGGAKLPPSDYAFEVTDAEKRAKDGKQRILLSLEVISDGPENGKKTWHSFNLSHENGLKRLRHFFNVIGLQTQKGTFSPKSLVGARFIGTVTHRAVTTPTPDGSKVEKSYQDISNESALPTEKPKAAPATRGVQARR